MAKKVCGYCFHTSGGRMCRYCGKPLSKSTSDFDALPVGTRLNNRYVVGHVLGRGGFGIIYLVYDEQNDRTAALKEYYPERIAIRTHNNTDIEPVTSAHLGEFTEGIERFIQEAQIISRFAESSEILGIYDVFRENGTACYVMDFIKGIPLKSFVEEHGAISAAQALFIAQKLLGALSVIHKEDVLHRDISPDNIMLCPNGSVRLIDFGSARTIADESKSLSIILKAGYAPLEQYKRRGLQGGWTDIYSLSMSLCFAVTGEEPDDPLTRLDDDSRLTELLGQFPPAFTEIIRRGGEIKVENRFKTAEEMLSAIKKCGISAQPIDGQLCRPKPTEHRTIVVKRSRKPIAVAAAAVTLVGAAAATTHIAGSQQPAISDPSSGESNVENTDEVKNENRTIELTQAVTAKNIAGLNEDVPEVKIGGEMFPINITELDLSDREITNQQIYNLSHLKQLKKLVLSGNYITDLSCLNGLSEMEVLNISNNNVADISFVETMPKLRVFSAENCGISDLSVFENKETLEQIYVGDNYVTDISPLKNCSRLTAVGVNEAQIDNIDALENKTELEKIYLTGCGLTSIEPLRNSKKLTEVCLGRNRLTDLSPLSGCTITMLYIDNNRLSGNTDSLSGITLNGYACMEGNGFSDTEITHLRYAVLEGMFELYY